MSVTWGQRWRALGTSGKNLTTVWLITAGIVAFYVGVIRPQEDVGGIASSRASGLAGDRSQPIGFWRQMPLLQRAASVDKAVVGDRSGVQPYLAASLSPRLSPSAEEPQDTDQERKLARTDSIELIVQKPAEAAEQIRRLAESLGGFLTGSQVSGALESTFASLTVRVPATRFEEARAAIRKLGLRVESETIEAQDVTRQFVDQAASLRNLRAEEAQYLAILKQARTVKDTLDVSEKLGTVRGQVEQRQAEFETLSKQIETVAMNISMRAEAEAQVFGLTWRPLHQVKHALREGLDGVGNYASTMTAVVFLLPTVGLWLATIIVGSAVAWRILRWVRRLAFGAKIATTAAQAS
jgi:hypothetical protein